MMQIGPARVPWLPGSVATAAALYDIHGNMGALEAVLAKLAEKSPDVVVIGGDISWGPEPAATLERVRKLPWPTLFVRGNTDRDIAAGQGSTDRAIDVDLWCRNRLSQEQLQFLANLPLRVELEIAGLGRVLFVHGSPRDDNEPIRGSTPEAEIAEMLAGVTSPLVVCGHTHIQFDRRVGPWRVVNAGSVGLQSCALGACWAWIGPQVQFLETPYDAAAQAAVVRRSAMPNADALATHLLRPPMQAPGRFVP